MKVALRHVTHLQYDAEVVEGVMDVRLGPLSDADQRWEGYELSVSPLGTLRGYQDGFGNAAHLVTVGRPHTAIELVAEGQIETLLDNPFQLPAYAPRPLTAAECFDYLRPSALVQFSDETDAMAEPFRPTDPDLTFEAVGRLMNTVHDGFVYEQNVTTVATTVAEVLAERAGVCQDFAHVLTALCRSIDVPARYVSGYIVQRVQTQSQTMGSMTQSQSFTEEEHVYRGIGASHAWVEAWTPTHGWRGFDATNNLVASSHHVKMAIGRDYADVAPTRGTFRGLAEERLSVEVHAHIIA
ncbi:MAG: transglutaminase family protein [Dehalococcoidia bacterium]